jgi:cold shock CspA family protein
VQGVVSEFDDHRGLGTIEAGGVRYPFHCTAIADGSRSIAVGTDVTFAVSAGPMGRWEARAVEPGAAATPA